MNTDVIPKRFESPNEVRVLSGIATAAFAEGRVVELRPGNLFYIPPEPHDSWVVGDEPYVSRTS